MTDRDTLCGWGDARKLAYFAANHDVIIPRRDEQLATVVELIPYSRNEAIRVLDLGCGFGALTEAVLNAYPQATVTAVDGSPAALTAARDYLRARAVRVHLELRDLADPQWHEGIAGPFAAIVSALAIHHLSDERKAALYREIRELLEPGGIFMNNEIVASPPALRERFESAAMATIQAQERAKRGRSRSLEELRRELDEHMRSAPATPHPSIPPLARQLAWLNDAGFASVDCYWRYLDFAIVGGVRQ
ncbi:MAG TPA: class I SAM-dependent methyltransferase [Candidatus Binataceae bacterium]|nr:class I SAM-dependent methyltransferase [Candidatus Binataceae bacterium]